MALITSYNKVTLAEAQRSEGYDPGSLGELARDNAFLDNIPFYPTNKGLYNKQVQADRLGAGAFGAINGSIPTGASGTSTIEEPVKLFNMESQVDVRLLQGLTPEQARATRDSQDEMNMAGVLDGAEDAIVSGNDGSTPDSLRGLMLRRASLSAFCLSMGGSTSGSMSSAFLIQIGRRGFHFAYPPGTKPGVTSTDKGEQKVTSADGNGSFYAWCRLFEFWCALVLRDNRALIRIPNIDTSTYKLTADKVITARNVLPSQGRDSILFVNRTVKTYLDLAAYNKTNAAVGFKDIEGYGAVTHVGGTPVALSDAITFTETTVS
jgi:hypothetical protein